MAAEWDQAEPVRIRCHVYALALQGNGDSKEGGADPGGAGAGEQSSGVGRKWVSVSFDSIDGSVVGASGTVQSAGVGVLRARQQA